jgi:hypothetical protein
MAYRAAEHETTGNTPNYMMLGREVTTPLDIQYCMPRSIAHIPQNRWAWILKDRMEETHKYVRENVKGAMHRQKKYYDQKLSWQRFQPGDQVFVFFPNPCPTILRDMCNATWHAILNIQRVEASLPNII